MWAAPIQMEGVPQTSDASMTSTFTMMEMEIWWPKEIALPNLLKEHPASKLKIASQEPATCPEKQELVPNWKSNIDNVIIFK